MDSSTPAPAPPRRDGIRANRILQTVFSVAVVLATMATCCTPRSLSFDLNNLFTALLTPQAANPNDPLAPTSQHTIRIGIVAGHWGNDSGSVCANGTTEMDVNLAIASLVQQKLTAQGYQVDLLQEFDPRLQDYEAAVLVSIHNDSCDYVNEDATGFKVAAAASSRDPNLTSRLTACLSNRYAGITGLSFHSGSITVDMTDYHAFEEISPVTTAAIIETGFLNLDYDILTQRPDLIADGIVAGIMCYVRTESVDPTPMPTP